MSELSMHFRCNRALVCRFFLCVQLTSMYLMTSKAQRKDFASISWSTLYRVFLDRDSFQKQVKTLT